MGAYGRHWPHVKIGITNDPNTRWTNGYRKRGWARMDVIYKSMSYAHVASMEKLLVKQIDVSSSEGWFWNIRGGGGGRRAGRGPFYLYVAVAPRYSRIS
jgi:hypothetical protein